MKRWPEDKTVDIEEALRHVRKAIEFAYELTRRNEDQDIPYYGYDIPARRHIARSPEEDLTVNVLAEHADQGRDALDVILGIAFALGVENGLRYTGSTRRLEAILERLEARTSAGKGDNHENYSQG